ncbi:MAG: hypothetical protein GXO29_03655 [Thermotogae bacterium]|nr:hypothetical protein [Thermotogota bacterium]
MIQRTSYALFALWAFSGCIYTFGARLPNGYERVFFAVPENRTGYPLVQDVGVGYGYQILRSDGRLKITDSASARLILRSVFTSYAKVPDKYDNSGKVITYRLNLSGSVAFVDKATGENFIPQRSFTGTTLWSPDNESEEEALKRAMGDFYSQAIRYLFSSVEW